MALKFLQATFNTDLGTLSAETAVILASDYSGSLAADFFCTGSRVALAAGNLIADDSIIIGIAVGAASATEIRDTLLSELSADPYDATSIIAEAQDQIVLWQTLRMINNTHPVVNEYMSMPGKGIVFREDKGVSLFAYNANNSALTTGSDVRGEIVYFGRHMSG